MTDQEITDSLSRLNTLVDALCIVATGSQDEDKPFYDQANSRIIHHGRKKKMELIAQHRFNQLEHERRILLEDYPSLSRPK